MKYFYIVITGLLCFCLLCHYSFAAEKEKLCDLKEAETSLERYKVDERRNPSIKVIVAYFTDRKMTDIGTKSEGPSYYLNPKKIIFPSNLSIEPHWEKIGWQKYYPYKLNKDYLLIYTDFRFGPMVLESTKENIEYILQKVKEVLNKTF